MPVISTLPLAGHVVNDTLAGATTASDLLTTAVRLRAAWQAGTAGRPLAGKNLAMLQPAGTTEASALQRAATDLGARVAQVSLGEPPPAVSEFAHIARMLGRLYDAIDASSAPPAAAAELEKHAGVPVYRGLGDDGPWLHEWAAHRAWVAEGADDRFLLQALLIRTLA